MTREERCWADLCKRLQRDPATSKESDTCTLRAAFKHALAFCDAEAAAMRERAAKLCDERGAEEQKGFGLTRAAQNYFRARDAIRDLSVTGKAGQ